MLSFKLLNAAASIMQGINSIAVVQEIHLQVFCLATLRSHQVVQQRPAYLSTSLKLTLVCKMSALSVVCCL